MLLLLLKGNVSLDAFRRGSCSARPLPCVLRQSLSPNLELDIIARMADQWPPGILLFACLALGWQGHDATAETSTLPTNHLSAPWFLYYAIFILLLNMLFRIDTVSLNKDSGKCRSRVFLSLRGSAFGEWHWVLCLCPDSLRSSPLKLLYFRLS